MTRLHIPLAVAAASFLLVGTAGADDAKARRKIEERLAKAGLDSSADIKVTVDGGTARLEGAVMGYEASYKAEKAARKEAKQVENRLVVGGEPRPDADIRRDVEKAILGYPYYGVFDSLEVGVEDGVVALRGVGVPAVAEGRARGADRRGPGHQGHGQRGPRAGRLRVRRRACGASSRGGSTATRTSSSTPTGPTRPSGSWWKTAR